MAGYWSAYWYRGFIYGTEIARGLDVLELLPSEFLTENEIVAASPVAPATFNAQDQRRIDWSTRPVVARAYLDQLGRSDTLGAGRRSALSALLDRADAALAGAAGASPAAWAGAADRATRGTRRCSDTTPTSRPSPWRPRSRASVGLVGVEGLQGDLQDLGNFFWLYPSFPNSVSI